MPTADRRRFVPLAIGYFLRQDWSNKELVILDDGTESVADLAPCDERVRYVRLSQKVGIGTKRNLACQQARGEIIIHWDDDDWSAPRRLRYQVEQLFAAKADICGLDHVLFYAPAEERAWEYRYPAGQRPWVYGASLCYTKAFWRKHPFPEIRVGEDSRFVWADAHAGIHMLPDAGFLVALIHNHNTSPKHTTDPRYHPKPVAEIRRLLGNDEGFYQQSQAVDCNTPSAKGLTREGTQGPSASIAARSRSSALVAATLGIGDILRVTPLIRALHRLGHDVDVLLATDYPQTAQLLEGAPEVRRVFQLPSARCRTGLDHTEGLNDQIYDLAVFTTWAASLRNRVQAKRIRAFDRAQWLAEGDTCCVERLARELGWEGDIPDPFAVASTRRFGLPPGAVALHPGCKYEWPWKKWHGFDELARRIPNVAILGADADLRNDNTYFQRTFVWPKHALNFVGQLSLPDTAALLRECIALVANDSGLMHLGVALGVPTFGLFGLTSPQREAMRAKRFVAITKGLPCEAACRRERWGRRDCARHLECLKSLTAEEVLMKVSETVPIALTEAPPRLNGPMASPPHGHRATGETINVVYHGWVFDASGYGHAARGNIHALHRAGVNVAVVDLAGRPRQVAAPGGRARWPRQVAAPGGRARWPRQVADPLVESLVGRKVEADFNLFHGIPPLWARHAFPLRNVIAITVWETDTMPTQWRPALNHALEVWLPCEFNVSVFQRALERPVFKLPHATLGDPAP